MQDCALLASKNHVYLLWLSQFVMLLASVLARLKETWSCKNTLWNENACLQDSIFHLQDSLQGILQNNNPVDEAPLSFFFLIHFHCWKMSSKMEGDCVIVMWQWVTWKIDDVAMNVQYWLMLCCHVVANLLFN